MKFMIAISLLALTASAQAQILKCVGKDGKIEFATACPPGTTQQSTGVSSKPAPVPAKAEKGAEKAADKASGPKTLAEQDAEFRKRQKEKAEEDAKLEKTTADDARRKQACEVSQSQLKQLQSRQRWARTDPKTGERVFLEEDGYIKEIAIVERQISENCK